MVEYGLLKSTIDGSEYEFKADEHIVLPDVYSYAKYLPEAFNQGYKPYCVPCTVSMYVNWMLNLKTGKNGFDNGIIMGEFYNRRADDTVTGMTYKDAFKILREVGVKTKASGRVTVDRYAIVGSDSQLKQALLLNGPCFGSLEVHNTNDTRFWDKTKGELIGYHAILIVGYNKKGFILLNSWGKSYRK